MLVICCRMLQNIWHLFQLWYVITICVHNEVCQSCFKKNCIFEELRNSYIQKVHMGVAIRRSRIDEDKCLVQSIHITVRLWAYLYLKVHSSLPEKRKCTTFAEIYEHGPILSVKWCWCYRIELNRILAVRNRAMSEVMIRSFWALFDRKKIWEA